MPAKKINTAADTQTEQTAAGTYIKTTKADAAKQKQPNKDRRVQLVIEPQEWEKFQAFAHLAGSTPNALICGYVHTTIEQYAKRIDAYERQRDEMQRELNIDGKEQK